MLNFVTTHTKFNTQYVLTYIYTKKVVENIKDIRKEKKKENAQDTNHNFKC